MNQVGADQRSFEVVECRRCQVVLQSFPRGPPQTSGSFKSIV
jgi:hypothetical protein